MKGRISSWRAFHQRTPIIQRPCTSSVAERAAFLFIKLGPTDSFLQSRTGRLCHRGSNLLSKPEATTFATPIPFTEPAPLRTQTLERGVSLSANEVWTKEARSGADETVCPGLLSAIH